MAIKHFGDYDKVQGYQYLRMIWSNDIENRELQSDCETAKRHKKSIDPWAVNRLNSVHGFNIKMSIEDKEFDEREIFTILLPIRIVDISLS